ncbi:hypothetical protein [Nocardioides sp. MH1]|uniref:hypothetical protein n=1 Tax=Nocardioides sp. MH1 TaxID=3242490 RepID=UPI00351FEBAD
MIALVVIAGIVVALLLVNLVVDGLFEGLARVLGSRGSRRSTSSEADRVAREVLGHSDE